MNLLGSLRPELDDSLERELDDALRRELDDSLELLREGEGMAGFFRGFSKT